MKKLTMELKDEDYEKLEKCYKVYGQNKDLYSGIDDFAYDFLMSGLFDLDPDRL